LFTTCLQLLDSLIVGGCLVGSLVEEKKHFPMVPLLPNTFQVFAVPCKSTVVSSHDFPAL
jgi:hypothetical protein